MDCQKAWLLAQASGPAADDAQWRHLPKPTSVVHLNRMGVTNHIFGQGTVPEERPLYPDLSLIETDYGTRQFNEMQRYCLSKMKRSLKLRYLDATRNTAEALVPWLGTGVWGKLMIRIPSGVAMQKREKAHDLSKAISDNPWLVRRCPRKTRSSRRPQRLHKRLKKCTSPKAWLNTAATFNNTKEGERAKYAACFVTLM